METKPQRPLTLTAIAALRNSCRYQFGIPLLFTLTCYIGATYTVGNIDSYILSCTFGCI